MQELRYLDKMLETLNVEEDPIREMELFIKAKIIDLGRFKDRHIILQKLIKDGYAEIKQIQLAATKNFVDAYFITFEGVIFIKKGGYSKEYKRLKSKTFFQDVLAWTIAIGSVLAAVFSILAFFHSNCP